MKGDGLSSISYSLIEEPQRAGITINRVLIAGLYMLIAWSGFAAIDVMIFATGKVITASSIKSIQHLEGGIIAEIYVKKGDKVEVGDPLLRIDNININTQLAEVQNRLRGIDASLQRLAAEIGGEESVDFDPNLLRDAPLLVANELQLFTENYSMLKEQTSSFNSRLRNDELAEYELSKQIKLASDSIDLMSEELAISESLLAEGAVSRVEVLQLRRSLVELKSNRQRLNTQLLGLENDRRQLQQELDQLNSSLVNKAINERNDLQNTRNELIEMIIGAQDKSSRSIVRSPVEGVVNQVLINTVGGVVQSGMELIEIVPNDDDFLIDTKVKPEDIGALALGQKANVRLSAYDFSIYGSMPGIVSYISADTLEEEDGEQFYVAHVRIDSSLVSQNTTYPVLTGMLAKVDIITGKRTVLSYITKPIVKTKERALREH
jgi:adhesin transport system membrane fusion protein